MATSLACMSGFVDAVGFLSLGGFFVSFMSGNTTRGSVGLVSGSWREAGLATGLVAAFVTGVIAGSVLGHMARSHRKPAVLTLVASVLLVSVALQHTSIFSIAAPLLLSLAMGAENAVFERDGEVSIGLTYMTGTLVKMGQSMARRLLGQPSTVWRRYAALWASMALGGVAGGLVYRHLGFDSVYVATAMASSAAIVAARLRL